MKSFPINCIFIRLDYYNGLIYTHPDIITANEHKYYINQQTGCVLVCP